MKPTLAPGIRHKHSLTVTEAMTVPALFRESETFRAMPPVLATGFMVGLMEWACLEAMAPHQESIWLIQTPSDRGHLVLEQERFAGRSGATHKKRDARQAQIPRPRRGGMWRPSGCVATLARCPASRQAARLADRLATCHQRGSVLARKTLDDNEGSVGVHVDMSHTAPTPVGMTVTADVELESIDGRLAWFRVVLRDEHCVIGEGRHQRAVIDKAKFLEKARHKQREAT